jgi:hypothetical protein
MEKLSRQNRRIAHDTRYDIEHDRHCMTIVSLEVETRVDYVRHFVSTLSSLES